MSDIKELISVCIICIFVTMIVTISAISDGYISIKVLNVCSTGNLSIEKCIEMDNNND